LSYSAADPEDEGNKDNALCLSVGGLIHQGKHDYEHLDWIKRSLKIGDAIAIRVVESDEVSPPIRREKQDPDFVAREQRRYYENLKQEYGETS
jgi:predicted RNA-binding protein with RPS1 domain